MSDLISREAVLESLKTDYSLILFDSYGNLTYAGERIIEAIKRVPSVEPEKCGDCISRQAAIDGIEWEEEYGRIDTGDAIKVLKALPSVTPERKTGKWVHMVGWWECDQCHAEYTDMPTCMGKVIYEYCPMCGAKMEVQNGKENS